MNELEACKLWVQRDFSSIPTDLLVKAYGVGDEIDVVAPTFEDWWEENKDDYEDEDEGWDSYYNDVGKYPMWGYVFVPDDGCDERWIKENAEEIAKLGFTVYYTDELGHYLGVNGAGYNFYEAHWLPLYRLRGFRWHDE